MRRDKIGLLATPFSLEFAEPPQKCVGSVICIFT
jgi:hypothetical protein